MQPAHCILFSGAAQGAEAAFGAAAERHGLEEVHFTFEGHNATRTRGMRVLTQAELKQGDVSLAYARVGSLAWSGSTSHGGCSAYSFPCLFACLLFTEVWP